MRHLLLSVMGLVAVWGCNAHHPATSGQPVTQIPEHVLWTDLVSDQQTAKAYLDRKISVRLGRNEYSCEGGEIRVWLNNRETPPVLIFKLRDPIVPTGVPIIVIGTCRGPQRDGIRRGLRGVDFCVYCEECTITVVPRSGP